MGFDPKDYEPTERPWDGKDHERYVSPAPIDPLREQRKPVDSLSSLGELLRWLKNLWI